MKWRKTFLITNTWLLLIGESLAQAELNPYLYYVNQNQHIDYLYFYDADFKLARSRQTKPGPLAMYLLNKHNLICDTLDRPVLPEQVFFGNNLDFYISGIKDFHQYKIVGESVVHVATYAASGGELNKNFCPPDVWRLVYLENRVIGLKGFGKKVEVISLDFLAQKTERLIAPPALIRLNNQRMLDYVFYYAPGYLYVFITPAQRFYKIKLADLSVTEFGYPFVSGWVWYFFLDHITGQAYSVADTGSGFDVYIHGAHNQLYYLLTLNDFSSAIFADQVHLVKEEDLGRAHYLIPVLQVDRENKKSNYHVLKEIPVKN